MYLAQPCRSNGRILVSHRPALHAPISQRLLLRARLCPAQDYEIPFLTNPDGLGKITRYPHVESVIFYVFMQV